MPAKRSLPDYALVFVIALAVHLLVLTRFASSPYFAPTSGDMKFYADWAERIAAGQWTDHQAFYGLPGYPFLLGGLFALGANYYAVGLLQIACEAGVAALLFQLAVWIFPGNRGRWAGVLAALGWTFFQPAQAYSLILMPTAWAVLGFWGIFYWSVKTESRSAWKPWLAIGAATGLLATLVATVLFVLPIALAAAVRNLRRPAAVLAAAACLALGVLAGTAPCWIHNRFVAGEPVWLSAHSGLNFWVGNHPEANGYPHMPPELQHASQDGMLKDSLRVARAEAGRDLSRAEVSQYWSAKASAFIQGHPGAWLRLLAVKTRNFWNAAQYDDLSVVSPLREGRITTPGLGFGPVAVFALAALPFLWRGWPRSRWVLGAVLLQMAALLPVFITERYRLAAVPGLFLLGSGGIVDFVQTLLDSHRTRQPWQYATPLIVAMVLVLPTHSEEGTLRWLDTYNSGLKALQTGDLELATRKLEAARRGSPGNADAHASCGNCYLRAGKTAEAKAAYLEALKLDPECLAALNNLAVIEMAGGDYASALPRIEAACKLDPSDESLKILLQRCQSALQPAK